MESAAHVALNIVRLDETLWSRSFEKKTFPRQLQIQTPSFPNRKSSLELAQIAFDYLVQACEDINTFKSLDLSKNSSLPLELRNVWIVSDITSQRYTQQGFSFWRHTFTNSGTRVFELSVSTTQKIGQVVSNWGWYVGLGAATQSQVLEEASDPLYQPVPISEQSLIADFLKEGAFKDPFTRLATLAFQTHETPFVSEFECKGSHRFVLRDGKLKLVANIPEEHAGTQEAALLYRNFLCRAFGWRFLARKVETLCDRGCTRPPRTRERFDSDFLVSEGYHFRQHPFEDGIHKYSRIFISRGICLPLDLAGIDGSNLGGVYKTERLLGYLSACYGIDLDDMVNSGTPLLPDHIFKCNIAVHNIEMLMVDSLFLRIQVLAYAMTNFPEIILNEGPIKRVQEELSEGSVESASDLLAWLQTWNAHLQTSLIGGYAELFSLREIRGLYGVAQNWSMTISGSEKTVSSSTRLRKVDFLSFLKRFCHPDSQTINSLKDIDPVAVDHLMQIFYIDSKLFESNSTQPFFTGRKITHLGVSGYKTMGNRTVFDPSRSLFELLHVFPELVHSASISTETLALVVCKKSLWSLCPSRQVFVTPPKNEADEEYKSVKELLTDNNPMRVIGRMLPLSNPNNNGQVLWYYVDGLINDHGGDFDYTLVPVSGPHQSYVDECGNGPLQFTKKPPLIKLYRSTASDPEAESSFDTIKADLKPLSIGTLTPYSETEQYVRAYFGRCTMPLWTAYLIVNDIEKAVEAFERSQIADSPVKLTKKQGVDPDPFLDREARLLDFITRQIAYIEDGTLHYLKSSEILNAFKERITESVFNDLMTDPIQGIEWDKDKIEQDILFIGHSLGGNLGQSGLYYYGPKSHRIPLFGCSFRASFFDSPGVTFEEANHFIQFGREHRDLIKEPWKIDYQFECEDLVPGGGSYLLGVHGYDDRPGAEGDSSWLEVTCSVCKALPETATDLRITTLPTHGRRFGDAIAEVDYKRQFVSIRGVENFKENWVSLPTTDGTDIRKTFGYYWSTPVQMEMGRKGVGIAFYIGEFLVNRIYEIGHGCMAIPDGVRWVRDDGVTWVAENGASGILNQTWNKVKGVFGSQQKKAIIFQSSVISYRDSESTVFV